MVNGWFHDYQLFTIFVLSFMNFPFVLKAEDGDEGNGSNPQKNSSSSRRNRRKFKSRLDPKQQKFAALTIVILTALIFTAMVTESYHRISVPNLSVGTHGHSMIRSTIVKKKRLPYSDKCAVAPIVESNDVVPIFTASFPGSGSKLSWQLIEALTGLKTGDDLTANGDSHFVSIKTHYPSHDGRLIPRSEKIPHAILLVRHPMYVFPSYFRRLYRYLNKANVHYPPVDKWIEWRNDNFDRQLQVWRRHTEYWMDHYSKANRIVITYEKLIDEEYGADESLKVADFLDRSKGVQSSPPEDVPCVWRRIVKTKEGVFHGRRLGDAEVTVTDVGPQDTLHALVQNKSDVTVVAESDGTGTTVVEGKVEVRVAPEKKDAGDAKSIQRRETEEYVAPFNKRQLRDLIQILTQLLERYRDDRGLAPILVSYIDEVSQRSQEDNK